MHRGLPCLRKVSIHELGTCGPPNTSETYSSAGYVPKMVGPTWYDMHKLLEDEALN
jgi:hypothetical protein